MKKTLLTFLLLKLLLVNSEKLSTNSDDENDLSLKKPLLANKYDWKVVFYTGDAVWSGTDSDIYIELIGDFGNSKVIILRPSKSQFEAKSVDIFLLGDLDGKRLGNLKEIVVGKQYSYAFFNDWQLIKVEVYDMDGKKYVFNCNCWFTSTKYKRLLKLSTTETSNLNESPQITNRASRVFPMTLGLLFLFFILISFTYFGKIMCNKWRENLIYFSNESNIESNHRNHRNRTNQSIYVNNEQYSVPLNTSRNQNSLIEDKPPDYLELFPVNQNHQTKLEEGTTTSASTVAPVAMQSQSINESETRAISTRTETIATPISTTTNPPTTTFNSPSTDSTSTSV